MIFNDAATERRFGRHLERVLVLEPQTASARLLVELLKGLGGRQINVQSTAAKALSAARLEDPQIIFTEFQGQDLDGLEFVRRLRRSEFDCRQAAVIMTTSEATAGAILGARDAGVHEFLRKPFNIKDLVRRIEAVTLKPRDWVEGVAYIGPDRRRFNSGDYKGPRKRKADTAAASSGARIEQALRIVKAALVAIEHDPMQAHRAMAAQAVDLIKLAVVVGDTRLATTASALQTTLQASQLTGHLDRGTLEAVCAPLWAYLPADAFKAA